ncbi:MAG: hypothetical protein WCR54_05750 [Clostridia bacterium]
MLVVMAFLFVVIAIAIMHLTNKIFEGEKIMEMALRQSNLVLPQGFVEMDQEEMMYVDGGRKYVTEYTNLDGICELAVRAGANAIGAVKGIALAAASSATIIGGIAGVLLAIKGIVGGTYAFANLIAAIKYYSDYGEYTITSHKVFGITALYYVGR